LLQQGAYVFGVDISPSPDIAHERFHFLQQDLTEERAPVAIVTQCLSAFNGHIDALLNIAGIADNGASVAKINDLDWNRIMAVNLTAPVRLMKEVVQVMRKQRYGNIVNMSSKAGISGAITGVAYTASKHALVSRTWCGRLSWLTFTRLVSLKIRHGCSKTMAFGAMRYVREVHSSVIFRKA
jgi:NAD(P)-dependent dehydrogenase (short-subunit alcohol dehydrogenase family)